MKKITFIVNGNYLLNPIITLDNKILKFKKGNNFNRICEVEVDKDELEIQICKWHELEGKHWFVFSLFFFFISLFGIFDIKQDKVIYSIKCKGKLRCNEQDSTCHITLLPFKIGEPIFNYQGNCDIIDILDNKYFIDEEITRRNNLLKKIKKIIRILAIAAIILTIILIICL